MLEECLSIASLLAGQTDFVRCQATILRQLLMKGSFVKSDIQMLEEKAREDVADIRLGFNHTFISICRIFRSGRELAKEVFFFADDPHIETVKKFGMACTLPGSFQGSLHAFLKHSQDAERFKATIRDVIRAGGCNCSRYLLILNFYTRDHFLSLQQVV